MIFQQHLKIIDFTMVRKMNKTYTKFAADFETTVYEGQTTTEVWSAAVAQIDGEFSCVWNSIDAMFNFVENYPGNVLLYFHNLKFDGEFILSYYLGKRKFKNAAIDETVSVSWLRDQDMANKTLKYVISDMGAWYMILIKTKDKFIEIRDSLKLIPFSLKVAGDSFKTEHRKLSMEYKGLRKAGGTITPEEEKYILHDVLVLKECLQYMFNAGHTDLTIGSCCLKEFKKGYKEKFSEDFPRLTQFEIDKQLYGASNVDQYIRRSYRGGWCYLKSGEENIMQENGCVFDVNSLYPSVMLAESGSWYPYGKPHMWTGNFIPDMAQGINKFYYIRLKCRFWLKENYLPFVQIKGNPFYDGTEMLETSDIRIAKYDKVHNRIIRSNKFAQKYIGLDKQTHEAEVIITLSCVDFALFLEHYYVEYEILDGVWFYAQQGVFDDYISKYRKIKEESTGGVRTIAKLFSNNLYGKMAASDISSFRFANYSDEDNMIHYRTIFAREKKPGYIPIGAAITSYARNFTIRAAQLNYDNFVYADTDSMHLKCTPDKAIGIRIDSKKYCCWKNESVWDKAIFVRAKTYCEHIKKDDGYEWDIKCAGLPQRSKDMFLLSIGEEGITTQPNTWAEKEFVAEHHEITDFKPGLSIPGKLLPKRFPGGVVLMETSFKIT